jgi:hypothetical protein
MTGIYAEAQSPADNYPYRSVRVSQQPGGDSSLSLAHDSRSVMTGIHAEAQSPADNHPHRSVRVSQQPGGDSCLSVAHYNSYSIDYHKNLEKIDKSCNFDDEKEGTVATSAMDKMNIYNSNVESCINDLNGNNSKLVVVEEEDDDEKDDKEQVEKDEETLFIYPLHYLTQPNMKHLNKEEQLSKQISILSNSIKKLYHDNFDDNHENKNYENNTSKADNKKDKRNDDNIHQHQILNNSNTSYKLSTTILIQCQALNLISYYSIIKSMNLFSHLQVIDNLLIISSSTDFLLSLCQELIIKYINYQKIDERSRYSRNKDDKHDVDIDDSDHHDQHHYVNRNNRDSNNNDYSTIWNKIDLQNAYQSTLSNNNDYQKWYEYGYNYLHITISKSNDVRDNKQDKDNCSNGDDIKNKNDSIVKNNQENMINGSSSLSSLSSSSSSSSSSSNGLFSIEGLHHLMITYNPPWPVTSIITAKIMNNYSNLTKRFLELEQISRILRILWSELRITRINQQQLHSRNSNKKKRIKDSNSKNEKKEKGNNDKDNLPVSVSDEINTINNKTNVLNQDIEDNIKRKKILTNYHYDKQISYSMKIIQDSIQIIYNFLIEKIFTYKLLYQKDLLLTLTSGMNGLVYTIQQYSLLLSILSLQLNQDDINMIENDYHKHQHHGEEEKSISNKTKNDNKNDSHTTNDDDNNDHDHDHDGNDGNNKKSNNVNDNNVKLILLDEYEYFSERNRLLHIKLCLNKMLSHCRSSLHKIYNINDVRNKTSSITTTQNKKNETIKSRSSNSISNSVIDDKDDNIDYAIPSYYTNSNNTTYNDYHNKKRKDGTNITMTIDIYMKQLQHDIHNLLFYRKLMIESAKIYSTRGDCIIDLDMIASYE